MNQPETDWRKVALRSAQQMERQARELIRTANMIRAELGLDTKIKVRHVPRVAPRNFQGHDSVTPLEERMDQGE